MRKRRWYQFAPSISAASYKSVGIACKPARYMTIPPPTLQSRMITKAGSTQILLPSQAGPSIPKTRSAVLSKPKSLEKIHCQRIATATPDKIAGR